jgi:uncharacterized protein YjbJ (UPF0337 family)
MDRVDTKDVWQGRWRQVRGKILETWGDITGDEVDRFQGQKDQLVGYLQERTGEARNAIQQKLDKFAEAMKR